MDLMARRRVMLLQPPKEESEGLPPEYQEVEYLENAVTSQGSACIDTGVYPGDGLETIVTMYVQDRTSYANFFGCQDTSGSQYYLNFGHRSYWRIYFGYNTTSAYLAIPDYQAGDWFEVDFQKGTSSVKNLRTGAVSSKATPATTYPALKVFLFDRNADGAPSNPTAWPITTRFSSCRMLENGVLIRNFVPCYRKSDGKPGMYDLAGKQFYTNIGTKEFNLGPDVS